MVLLYMIEQGGEDETHMAWGLQPAVRMNNLRGTNAVIYTNKSISKEVLLSGIGNELSPCLRQQPHHLSLPRFSHIPRRVTANQPLMASPLALALGSIARPNRRSKVILPQGGRNQLRIDQRDLFTDKADLLLMLWDVVFEVGLNSVDWGLEELAFGEEQGLVFCEVGFVGTAVGDGSERGRCQTVALGIALGPHIASAWFHLSAAACLHLPGLPRLPRLPRLPHLPANILDATPPLPLLSLTPDIVQIVGILAILGRLQTLLFIPDFPELPLNLFNSLFDLINIPIQDLNINQFHDLDGLPS